MALMPATPRAKTSRVAAKAEAKPRTKPAEVRREELLDAAERLFLDKGIAATSVDEIVALADVAKGTFYLHFASKEALLLGLQQRYLARFFSGVEKALAKKKPDDYRGRLRAWVQAGLDGFFDQYELHEMLFHENRPQAPLPMEDDVNPVFQSMMQLMRDGAAAGAWELSDPDLTGIMLLHALHGATHSAAAVNTPAARKHLQRTLEAFALRVVGEP
jgi:AcrR family transcriptional regulator